METYSTEIYEILSKNENIIIAGHVNPDGDAVCSVLAMALSISLIKKNPIVLLGDYSSKYDFVEGKEYIYNGNLDDLSPDVFIAIDCGDKNRLGEASKVFDRAKVTFNIDHHISNQGFAQNNIVYPKASSSSEIVFEIIKNFFVLNRSIASAIYAGIISDTCGFKHGCTTPKTHEIARRLIEFNIPFTEIQTRIMYLHSVSEVKVFSKAISQFNIDNNISYTTLTRDEIKSCGADYTDLDGIVEYLLNIDDVKVSLFLYEKEDGIVKISLRANDTDVNKIAAKYGGGGHRLAAGASFDGTIEQAKNELLNEIKKELDSSQQPTTKVEGL